jgi:hypothetical protein
VLGFHIGVGVGGSTRAGFVQELVYASGGTAVCVAAVVSICVYLCLLRQTVHFSSSHSEVTPTH